MSDLKHELRVRLRYLRFRLWWIPFRKPANPPLNETVYFRWCGMTLPGRLVGGGTISENNKSIRYVTVEFDAPMYRLVDDDGNELADPVPFIRLSRDQMPASHLLWGYEKR
ncbi:hypothetical protein SEA_BEARBQ_85 [Gordonia phage BearBQ]|nr:hypothetical protein SEA_BEARBQ_85 [Gordonia phage BearBQ]